jgi:SUF system NifU family Fe-S assembly protein
MIEQLDELYRDVILDHFKNPTHAGALPDAEVKADGANPLCGDELTFHIKLTGGRCAAVRFRGKGCAISQAAASMLATQAEGKPVAEVRRLIDAMKALMQGQEPAASVDLRPGSARRGAEVPGADQVRGAVLERHRTRAGRLREARRGWPSLSNRSSTP